MSSARLFVALWPDDAIGLELARRRDAWSWPRSASPVKTDRLHVTLHFLGDVKRELIAELSDALAVPFAPFALELGQAKLWPHGIAVLDPVVVPAALMHLHARLEKALAGSGIATDARAYRPHVTLARRAGGTMPPADAAPLRWQVGGYRLMESRPGADGGYFSLRGYPD